MRACGLAVVAALCLASPVESRRTAPVVPVAVIVELFTSEGCSSCPPADDLLAELVSMQPVLGALVIGLGEHVDYWNRLGWSDPFSLALFSDRQNAYAANARTNSIYTPQMIVDGGPGFVGSERDEAIGAITAAARIPKTPMRLAWSTTVPSSVDVAVSGIAKDVDVRLAIVESGLATDVKQGENAGRRLRHSAVTRVLRRLGATDRGGAFSMSVPIVLAPAWTREHVTIVAFAQLRGPGRIVSIATLAPR